MIASKIEWCSICGTEHVIGEHEYETPKTISKKYSDYSIKENLGIPQLNIIITWTDGNDKEHHHETNIIEEAETIMGLLSGTIKLSDLEP